jgi:hypothetical protein
MYSPINGTMSIPFSDPHTVVFPVHSKFVALFHDPGPINACAWRWHNQRRTSQPGTVDPAIEDAYVACSGALTLHN